MTCAEAKAAWALLVAQPQVSTAKDDCMIGGSNLTCDCGWAIGQASGDALAKVNLPEANKLQWLWYSKKCDGVKTTKNCTWDAAKAQKLRCEAGLCKADAASCVIAPPLCTCGKLQRWQRLHHRQLRSRDGLRFLSKHSHLYRLERLHDQRCVQRRQMQRQSLGLRRRQCLY